MLLVPIVLIGLLAWIFADSPLPVFDQIGAALLGVFPFVVMFIVTSVATLRERSSGTLERLLTTPLGKGDFMFGYAIAFGLMAIVQALVATAFAVWVCGLNVAGPAWILVVIAVFDALLGTALGLLASGFARTEFQAVQFMPAFVLPQFLLCGLLVARDQLPSILKPISDVLPLSYAVDAMKSVTASAEPHRRRRCPTWGSSSPGSSSPSSSAASPCAAARPDGVPVGGSGREAARGAGVSRLAPPAPPPGDASTLRGWMPVTCFGAACSSSPSPTSSAAPSSGPRSAGPSSRGTCPAPRSRTPSGP